MRPRVVAAAAACLIAGGCSSDDGPADEGPASAPARTEQKPRPEAQTPKRHAKRARARRPLTPARCPAALDNCRTASGEIVYVERVDPDGDGDAHFVLLSDDGITGPGLSVIDVERSLRPHPLPGPGDRISAAGPFYKGSYGQRQIEAVELHVARAG
jgi:hypothetical protein